MRQAIAGIDFAPVLPLWLLAALGAVSLLVLVPAFWRRARGTWLRAGVFALLLLALSNPRLVEETRETRPDIALLLVDRSDSARIGEARSTLEDGVVSHANARALALGVREGMRCRDAVAAAGAGRLA